MPARNQDFEITEGDNVNVVITVTDSTGGPVDLTTGTNKWGFAKEYDDTPLVTVTSTNIAISSTDNNVATIPILGTSTVNRGGVYVHELAHKDSSNNQRTLTQGTLTIRRQLIAST